MASEDKGSDVSNEILYYNNVSEESSDGSEGEELDLHVIEPYQFEPAEAEDSESDHDDQDNVEASAAPALDNVDL